MSEKKNLDRLFQEKLQNFEQEPRPDIWGQIQDKMQQKKKRRIAIWWYAAAALVLLGLFIFIPENQSSDQFRTDPVITNTPNTEDSFSYPSNNGTTKEIVKTPEALPKEEQVITEQSIVKPQTDKPNRSADKTTITKEVIATNIPNNKTHTFRNLEKNLAVEKNENFVKDPFKINEQELSKKPLLAENTKKTDSSTTKPISQKKKPLLIKIEEDIPQITEQRKKWSVRPLVAFSTMMNSSNSPVGNSFADNPTSGNTSLNYGLSVAYEMNDKLILQTGVMTQNMSFSTQDVLLILQNNVSSASPEIGFRQGVSYIVSGSNSLLTVGNSSANVTVADTEAELNQIIRYIEIPVEAKYRITKSKKIRSYITGGFSSLFLQNDEILLQSDVVGPADVGRADNLNTINFSGNFGLDLDYMIHKNLFFNINPMVKVPLRTFSGNSNGYQPYFFGVYSGVKYQF